jgi:hypothetical protein
MISETRKGTRTLSGSTSLGITSGAVYIFQRKKYCRFCSYQWSEIKKLTILDCHHNLEGSEQFGWSVAIHGDVIFVGAPGFRNNTGNIYVIYRNRDDWTCRESFSESAWKDGTPGDRFGHSLVFKSLDTLLVGVPGYSSSEGCVLVFRRSPSFHMLLSQKIIAENPHPGALFGHSVALHNNSAFICAPYMIQNGHSSGTCTTYERISINHNYVKKQTLIPSNVRKFDRFGWSVAMSGGQILVGQLQEYDGKMVARYVVQTIKVICAQRDCSEQTFEMSWRDGMFKTRPLPLSVSAKQLKETLENELHTGPIQVSRSELSNEKGGYKWAITFATHASSWSSEIATPKLSCEIKQHNEYKQRCSVDFFGGTMDHVRGKVHLFTASDNIWVEQAYLFPAEPQLQDDFGYVVDVDNNIAVVGAPNRNLLNINSGAAIIYDISFSNYYFNSSSYTIEEGETLEIPVHKRKKTVTSIIGIRSLDINAEDYHQNIVNMMWGPFTNELRTPIELITGNTASTNDQYYGNDDNRSEWVNGMFDYRATNDYQSIDYQIISTADDFEMITLKTVNDKIFESPNEVMTIQIALPGMFASPLGQLRTDITIEDDGDGVIQNELYYSKFCNSIMNSCQYAISDMDTLPNGNLLVVGNESLESTINEGLAQIFSFVNHKRLHVSDIRSPLKS